jgi:hypothetical protein
MRSQVNRKLPVHPASESIGVGIGIGIVGQSKSAIHTEGDSDTDIEGLLLLGPTPGSLSDESSNGSHMAKLLIALIAQLRA